MSQRPIKDPAGKGTVSISSLAAVAEELRAAREIESAAPPRAPAKKRTPNAAFMKAMQPSAQLAAIVGAAPLRKTQVTQKVWEYIKRNGLQDSSRKSLIHADVKLREIFKSSAVSMGELTALVNKHLK